MDKMNVQYLTIAERRTIFQILVLIMEADCIVVPEEIAFLDDVFKKFEFDISEFDHMEEMTLGKLANAFSFFSTEKKEYAKALFKKMAACDGNVDPREQSIIEQLFK